MPLRRGLIHIGDQGLLVVENIIISLLPVKDDRIQQHFIEVNDVRFNLFQPFVPFKVILKNLQVFALKFRRDPLVMGYVLVHLHHHFIVLVLLRQDLFGRLPRGILHTDVVSKPQLVYLVHHLDLIWHYRIILAV